MSGSRRLKVAFVVHDYNRYMGHSRYVAELATRYRHDHEVHVYANRVDDADLAGMTFHHVRAWRRNAFASIMSFIIPGTLAVKGDYDVVHAQGLCGLRHNLTTAHFCQSGWYERLERAGIALTPRQKIFRAAVTPMEKRAICQRATRKVIAISERIRQDLGNYYGRRDGIELVYHGTDVQLFHPGLKEQHRKAIRSTIGVSEDQFLALYVGDLKKGCVAAIRATARTPGVKLLILSQSSPAPYLPVVEEEKVESRVIFHPRSKEVQKFFAASDVFLFPTIYDPFGLVITEAMATGLPVITSRAAGASELITSGVDGLLTEEAWDIEALAAHLQTLRDDPGLRERMGLAARARVEPMTWDKTADETMAVYQDLARERQE